jgi:electron-transferring-flavoprotein dehydrogenase
MAKSKAIQELKRVRNIRPGFYRGRLWGLGNALLETALHGYSPWTYSLVADHTKLQPKDLCTTITYPKPDGNYIFSKTDSVRLSATNHTEDQPCHLILKDPSKAYAINYKKFGGPEQYYCPANVYEYVMIQGKASLQINGQNCIHCKTCAVKDPNRNIKWVPPQGGEGPRYSET